MSTVSRGTLTLSSAWVGDENPFPRFRNTPWDLPGEIVGEVEDEKRATLGRGSGYRVLPYRMQDVYSRQRAPRTFRTLVLENDILRATFLPELGARLASLVHKPSGRELLAVNRSFQPANLALRNAWFSGGIEWNLGQLGHHVGTCSAVFAGTLTNDRGEAGLRFWEYERMKNLFWQMDFWLPNGSPVLVSYVRITNPQDNPVDLYWWTNIAVPEAPGVRVLAPADQALCIVPSKDLSRFALAQLPGLPTLGGEDGTYSLHSPFANEFFFQCESSPRPWEAALDAEGAGLFEASTRRLAYRKVFAWGNHTGGQRWQRYLAPEGGGPYIEIQAGLAPTQLHPCPMPARTPWDWTEVFGLVEADPRVAHSSHWPEARNGVQAAIARVFPVDVHLETEAECRRLGDRPVDVILSEGSGWGRVERLRAGNSSAASRLTSALVFPAATIGRGEREWLSLLETGLLSEPDPRDQVPAWMVQPEWKDLLEASLSRPGGRHWYSLLHLGVMEAEAGNRTRAQALWTESWNLRPSIWAARNLAAGELALGHPEASLTWYARAWGHRGPSELLALSREYLEVLLGQGHLETGWELISVLPFEVRSDDRVALLEARFSAALGYWDNVEDLLNREYSCIREGEVSLTDLWLRLHAHRLAALKGVAVGSVSLSEVEDRFPPPEHLDMRLFSVWEAASVP